MSYAYSPDLVFTLGWAHFFAGDAVDDATPVLGTATDTIGAVDDDDWDYLYLGMDIAF